MSVKEAVKGLTVDPTMLRESAAASLHAGVEAWLHMRAEFAGDIDRLMETLVEDGPWAYTIMPQVSPDGVVRSPVMTSYDDIRECYKFVRGRSDLLRVDPLVEIKGTFYVFHNNLSYGRIRATGVENKDGTPTLAIFPVSAGSGITGELVWAKVPRERLGAGPAPAEPLQGNAARRQLLQLHEQYLDGLRANDVEAILATMNDGVQSNIRDYVNDTGTLIGLDGKQAYRDQLSAFFDRYEVLGADHIHRIAEDWYLFAELRLDVRERRAGGRRVAWHTAELFIPAKDDRFIVQTGHGTDPD